MCYHFRSAPGASRQFAVVGLRWDPGTDLPLLAID
jgi:hypothetical protein